VPKVAKPGPTDRQNWRLLYVTWLIPSAIKNDWPKPKLAAF